MFDMRRTQHGQDEQPSPAFGRFDAVVNAIMSVSRVEITRREQEYKQKAALNPNKRGPKPKRRGDDPGPAVQPPA